MIKNSAVIYARYSTEDEIRDNKSRSISNQIEILKEYAKDNGFEVIDTYYDYMYSGKDFNRPSVKRLIKDASEHKFDVLLLKDLSRFGRNYIDVGTILNESFINNDIRVIAVNDRYDSKYDFEALEFPIKNYFNELYLKDVAKKIRRVTLKKGEKEFLGNKHYGYIKVDNEFKIYEPEAKVVKEIYKSFNEGKMLSEIRDIIESKGYDTPSLSYYKKTKKDDIYNEEKKKDKYKWNVETIREILNDEFYTGVAINFKTDKVKSTDKRNIRIENHHKPIIKKEDFDKVDRFKYSSKTRDIRKENLTMFLCKKCLSRYNLAVPRSHISATTINDKNVYHDYGCNRSYPIDIMNKRIYDMVILKYENIRNHKDEYISRITKEKYEEVSDLREVAANKKKYEAKLIKLFESYTDGRILIEEYKKESIKTNNLIKECEKKLKSSNLEEYKVDEIINKVNRFINLFYKSDNILEVIKEFVSKAIYNPDNGSIDIILKLEEELDIPSSRLSSLVEVRKPTIKDFNIVELTYDIVKKNPHIKCPDIHKELLKIFDKFTLSNTQRALRVLRLQDRIIFEGKADLIDGYVIKEFKEDFDYKGMDLNTKDKFAYRILWNNPKMSYEELSEALDTSLDRTRRIVKNIRRQGGFNDSRFDKEYIPNGSRHSIYIEDESVKEIDDEGILNRVRENPKVSSSIIAKEYGISKTTALRHIRLAKAIIEEEKQNCKKEEHD